jgi:sugar phosphate isomerase/epimerase
MMTPRTINPSAQNDQMLSVNGSQFWLQAKMKSPVRITTIANTTPPSEMLRTGPQDTYATPPAESRGRVLTVRIPRPQRPMSPRVLGPVMVRIGGSTYSKRPFPPQVQELKEAGFDTWDIDLTWLEPGPRLEREALALAQVLPIETAHLPPCRFTRQDQERFQKFLDYTAFAGPKVFNVHLMPSRTARGIPLDTRTVWLAEFVDAARSRGLTVTLENLDETLPILAEVFTRVPRLKACLDVGHASLDGQKERPLEIVSLLGDRLALVHAHDNRQGHGEAGDLHLPFGRGTIPLESILRGVRRSGFDGHVTLEFFSGTREEKAECLAQARAWLGPSGPRIP